MNIVTPTKKFVREHRVAIAVVGTSIAWIAIMQRAMKQHNDFLKEKGLYDEFWTEEEN